MTQAFEGHLLPAELAAVQVLTDTFVFFVLLTSAFEFGCSQLCPGHATLHVGLLLACKPVRALTSLNKHLSLTAHVMSVKYLTRSIFDDIYIQLWLCEGCVNIPFVHFRGQIVLI